MSREVLPRCDIVVTVSCLSEDEVEKKEKTWAMRFVRVGTEGFFQQAGKSDQQPQSGRPTIPAFAAANEICAHYFLQASGGCSGGHVNIHPSAEVEPQWCDTVWWCHTTSGGLLSLFLCVLRLPWPWSLLHRELKERIKALTWPPLWGSFLPLWRLTQIKLSNYQYVS